VEGNRTQVSRKNYCNLSADHLRGLEKIQFSIGSKHKNENLEKLYNIIGELGLLTLIKGQRPPPNITATSILGYMPAHILRRRKTTAASMHLNQFLDDTTPFDAATHTLIVPVHEDDVLCYQSDLLVLKRIINIVFDQQLLLSARQLIVAEDEVIEAFHYLVNKIRGNRQSDINMARGRYDSYIKFDKGEEVSVSLAALAILQNELVFASGLELSEDQLLQKLHQCAFNDERSNVSQAVMHSIGIKSTFQQTVSYLVDVMERLPLEKQTVPADSAFNSMNTSMKKQVCFHFQKGRCDRRECRFSHDVQDTKENGAKGESGEIQVDMTSNLRNTSVVNKDKDKKPFKVQLSEADRRYVGAPRGTASMNNMEGWSRTQMVLIHNMIASNEERDKAQPNQGQPGTQHRSPHQNDSYVDDRNYRDEPTPDQLYKMYEFQSNQRNPMRSNIPPVSTDERSHYMNSLTVI
jgi:hypothetical protein